MFKLKNIEHALMSVTLFFHLNYSVNQIGNNV